MEDDDFIALNEFILEMANVNFYMTEHFLDEEISLKPSKVETKTPIQLVIEIDDENGLKIGAIPPMYYVETTFMPVFHSIELKIENQN